MRYKIFGEATGLKGSELVLGAAVFGTASGHGATPDEARDILRAYAEAGGNVLDTADAYQSGESETLVGEFLASRRDDFILCSKYSRSASRTPALAVLGNTRKAMVRAVEASLTRLRTDRIDLYQAHLDDGVTPIEEIVRGFEDLVRAGKILHGGLSNFPAWRVATAATTARLRGWTPLAAIQVEYNLVQRATDRELLPMAQGFGLAIMGYSPLGGGLLTGKYRQGGTGRVSRIAGGPPSEDPETTTPVLDTLIAIAGELGATPGQVAIAWVKSRGVFPVIGPRSRAQLEDNLGAAALSLGEEHLRRLEAVSTPALGYPHDMLVTARRALAGERWSQLDLPARPVV
jgi:aryl-alcohol dehydrogenase-like predicted oxidoreductase